ncbi:hypothetical protein, partial [Vibrio harveyi]
NAKKALAAEHTANLRKVDEQLRAVRKEQNKAYQDHRKASAELEKKKPTPTQILVQKHLGKGHFAAILTATSEKIVIIADKSEFKSAGYFSRHLIENPSGLTYTNTDANGFETTVKTMLVTIKPINDFKKWMETSDEAKAIKAKMKEADDRIHALKREKQDLDAERD